MKNMRNNVWFYFHLSVLIFIGILCFLGPFFYHQDYRTQNLILGAQAPSWNHILGTDILGRDLLARLLYGGRMSIFIGFLASGLAIFIGLIYGSLAGFIGGTLDRIMMRIIDIIYPLPFTLLVILIMSLGGRHLFLLILIMGCVKWLTMARIIRAQVLNLKLSTFVQCSQSMGQSGLGIWIKHIFPNLVSVLLVYGTLLLPNIILEESFVSFLGLGVQPPMSSWGVLILEGARQMEDCPWLLIFPCLFFSLTLFSLNCLGDILRDKFGFK